MDGMQGPLLSLRDLCLLDDLPVLCASGVRSLKVEGRLKSPEYVAVVTSVYRRALDAVAQGNFRPDPVQREQLLQIFNRGGFTRGHILGAEDADLVTPDRVSHEGLPLGKVQAVKGRLAALHVDRALHDGDSLQLRGAGEATFDPTEAKKKNPRQIEAVILKNRNGRVGEKIEFEYYPMFNYFTEKG